jgi:hypothetical protein
VENLGHASRALALSTSVASPILRYPPISPKPSVNLSDPVGSGCLTCVRCRWDRSRSSPTRSFIATAMYVLQRCTSRRSPDAAGPGIVADLVSDEVASGNSQIVRPKAVDCKSDRDAWRQIGCDPVANCRRSGNVNTLLSMTLVRDRCRTLFGNDASDARSGISRHLTRNGSRMAKTGGCRPASAKAREMIQPAVFVSAGT